MTSNAKLNILFITRRFPPSVGGMQKFAYQLSEALNQKAKIHLIKWGGNNKYIPVMLIPVFFVRACYVLLTKPVDVIHMQDGVYSIWGVVLKYLFRKPMTVVIHGLDITHGGKLYQFLVPRALKHADHINCISHMAMAEVIKRGIPENTVSVIPLGVEDSLYLANKKSARQEINNQLKLQPETKIILSAGRLVKRKGVNWFVDSVMPKLVAKDSKVMLVVSGDGPERDTINETIKRHNLGSHVRLLDRTSDELVQFLYNGSDVFVMPNISVPNDMEGFGLVLLEAALCELPIVAAGIEGINDAVIDGQNGVLVKEKDTASFVKQISSWLDNPTASHQMGKQARAFTLRHFGWNKIAQQYINEYQKLFSR